MKKRCEKKNNTRQGTTTESEGEEEVIHGEVEAIKREEDGGEGGVRDDEGG